MSDCVAKTDGVASLGCLGCIFQNIFQIVIRLGGVLAFIMLLVGGFQYLTSGGDPKKTQMARNTLTFAILGLVLLILAWFILLFIKEFTGVDVTEFKIGS